MVCSKIVLKFVDFIYFPFSFAGSVGFKRFLYVLFFFVLPVVALFWFLYHCYKNGMLTRGKLADNMYVSTSSFSIGSKEDTSPDSSISTTLAHKQTPARTAPPPLPLHTNRQLSGVVTNTAPATITNIHAILPRHKSNPDVVHQLNIPPPSVPKSHSTHEVRPKAATLKPLTLLHSTHSTSNNNNTESLNQNDKSNTNNSTLRRKLDITAPRLNATTNPLALTEGAQFIQSDPARCAKY